MESTPKERLIHIKCDPSKPNSAWNWLERQMSVSSAKPTPQLELTNEELERERKTHLTSLMETVLPSETKGNPITHDIDDFKFQECHPTSSSVGDNVEQLQLKISKSDAEEPSGDKTPFQVKLCNLM